MFTNGCIVGKLCQQHDKLNRGCHPRWITCQPWNVHSCIVPTMQALKCKYWDKITEQMLWQMLYGQWCHSWGIRPAIVLCILVWVPDTSNSVGPYPYMIQHHFYMTLSRASVIHTYSTTYVTLCLWTKAYWNHVYAATSGVVGRDIFCTWNDKKIIPTKTLVQ